MQVNTALSFVGSVESLHFDLLWGSAELVSSGDLWFCFPIVTHHKHSLVYKQAADLQMDSMTDLLNLDGGIMIAKDVANVFLQIYMLFIYPC